MRTKLHDKPSYPYGLIGKSKAICAVYNAIEKASQTNATVLITGESGTGKELAARAIHYISSRASATFVPVNCGGIPETLLESELFGYVKGAFTGAFESRAGFFQTADGGTIFLDEISETSFAMQVLRNYYWPGNVRELKNIIQRLVIMNESDVIDVPDLPQLMRFSAMQNTGFNRSLAEVEVEYISNVLASVNGNKTRAAKILGIDRKTLREKLKDNEISV